MGTMEAPQFGHGEELINSPWQWGQKKFTIASIGALYSESTEKLP